MKAKFNKDGTCKYGCHVCPSCNELLVKTWKSKYARACNSYMRKSLVEDRAEIRKEVSHDMQKLFDLYLKKRDAELVKKIENQQQVVMKSKDVSYETASAYRDGLEFALFLIKEKRK